MRSSTRNVFYDLVKVLCIIAIVFGHTNTGIFSKYVYTFHIALFFFVAGLLYKHKEDMAKSLYSKVVRIWQPYVAYSFIYLCANPIFLALGIQSSDPHTPQTIAMRAMDFILLSKTERLTGPMWFAPFFLLSSLVFIIMESSCSRKANISLKRKNTYLLILCMLGGIIGMIVTMLNYNPAYRANTALLLLPFTYLGYIFTANNVDIKKLLNFPIFIISVGLVFFTLIKTDLRVELSQNQVINPFLFYPLTLLGMYSCCYLAKLISKIPRVNIILAELGKYTFDIMAMHLLFLKLVDYVYINLFTKDFDLLSKYPRSYSDRWGIILIYVIVGVCGPVFTRKLFDFAVAAIKEKFSQHKSKAETPISEIAETVEAVKI